MGNSQKGWNIILQNYDTVMKYVLEDLQVADSLTLLE